MLAQIIDLESDMGQGLNDFWQRTIIVVTHPLDPIGVVLVIRAEELVFLEVCLAGARFFGWDSQMVVLHGWGFPLKGIV